HGNRLSKRRVHASACFDRRAATPEWMARDFRAAFSRSFPRPRSRHFPLTSDSAAVASRVTSTAQRSPWRYGPANVFGLRRHLSRKSFAFLTQTGGPSCLEALGRDDRSLGEARYSRAAWTKVASCSMPTALATLRFGSTGSTTISGSGKARAGGRSKTMTVPGRQERLLSRTPRKLPYFRIRSSQR